MEQGSKNQPSLEVEFLLGLLIIFVISFLIFYFAVPFLSRSVIRITHTQVISSSPYRTNVTDLI